MSDWKIIARQTSDTTNLHENPSLETNTTGYAAGTNWTLARDGTYAYRGIYSGKLTASASAGTIMCSFTPPTNLTASTVYYVKCWLYVDTWNGGNIRIGSSNFTSSSESYTKIYTDGTSPTGQWIELKTTLTLDSDNTGTIDIESTSAASASDIVYFDSFLISTVDVEVFDGDTDNCYWTGAEHASTSVAPAYIRNVGVETDIDDLNLTILAGESGIGMPAMRHASSEFGGHGAIYRSTKAMPRVITLMGYHPSTTRATLHSYRKDILDLIVPNEGQEEFYLRYYGANSDKPVEGAFVYDAGYEFGQLPEYYHEDIAFRCIAYDPFWHELPQQKTALTTRGTGTFDYIAAKVDGDWSDLGSTFNGGIRAFAYDKNNDILYVGGAFTSPHQRIAKYEDGSWSALDVGLEGGDVYALALAPDGTLYVGGAFTDTYGGGTTLNYIAEWDGTNFSALGTGMNNTVDNIAIDHTGKVYVTGYFTTGNSVTLNYVGYWNGTTFVAMDSGVSTYAHALAIDKEDNVYIGGEFTTAGSGATTVNYITKWSGAAYEALDSGLSALVSDIAIGDNGIIYVGGSFDTASGITVNKIAAWTGAGWYALGSGLSGGNVINMEYSRGLLWVTGTFTSASGLTLADRAAIWNGAGWVHIDVDFPGTPTVYDILIIRKADYENVYLAYTTTGTATYSVDTTVTNNSTALSYPILTVWNEGGSSNTGLTYLKNESTGATVWMDYTLQPEEKITINFSPNNFDVISSYFGNVSYAILSGSDLDFYLRPGANTITCFTPDASITAALTWRPAHWSVDGVAA